MIRISSLILASLALSAVNARAQTTLREAASAVGLNIGAAVTGNSVTGSNRAYQDIVKKEFNTLVCENDMKFQSTQPSQGRFSFNGGDNVLKFAQANTMAMRGHTLVWHSQSGWASSYNGTREQMLRIIKTHIDTVVGRYKGKILEWDVVNEAVADNSTSLRNSFWRQRIGEDFIDSAFAWAHRADPAALLYYNDYGAEGMNTKSNGVYELVKRLKSAGIPIHGVGLQSHFGANLNKADIDRNIKRIGALGLRVSITELDIVDPSGSTKPWTDLMDACLANANCTSFITWGVYDAMSWKAQGGTCNCLIFDTGLKPKAVHGALLASMAKADPSLTEARKKFAADPTTLAPAYSYSPRKVSPAFRAGVQGQGFLFLDAGSKGGPKWVDLRGRASRDVPRIHLP